MQRVDPQSGIDLVWASQTVGLAASETDAIVRWACKLSNIRRLGKCPTAPEAGLFQKMGVPTVSADPVILPKHIVPMNRRSRATGAVRGVHEPHLDTGYATA